MSPVCDVMAHSKGLSGRPQLRLEKEAPINLVADAQTHRTNMATMELMHNSIRRQSSELATLEQAVDAYFVEIDFNGLRKRSAGCLSTRFQPITH